MRLSEDVIGYFKKMADEKGVPYQSLINLYCETAFQAKGRLTLLGKRRSNESGFGNMLMLLKDLNVFLQRLPLYSFSQVGWATCCPRGVG